ncbi:hypothetical protein ACH79_20720 [Bradyrhizobium sp. CCBAU 051011]|uniref:DUF5343 domain-containing protein n=1 Tax=Bradyrhizobium sp. CCBAU 051011 TaxID=858422 RepID=UPI001373C34C|nr:DUF5343 domain-containing protein [Bradyrhizobium sp. CCBAU 051011]QHO74695.1 hypothetical protein ACH79_20720 [Bradyrhizobium sp. CCBAU 051011]
MALPDVYVQIYGQLPDIFKRISEGQAPDKFTSQYLKDIGFQSTNHRAIIPLLKALGFLSAEGVPTSRYHSYRDHSQARRVMGQAVREAYSDLFTIKAHPTDADRSLIEGKFKSAHNTTERMAKLMTSTFYSLLPLADLTAATPSITLESKQENEPTLPHEVSRSDKLVRSVRPATLHYNIQIHLPATKDVEVFNAIFKSLREHLLD